MPTASSRTDERLALISWTARLGAVTATALARRDGISLRSARSRLAAAGRAGLLERHPLLADAEPLYSLTRAGLRASGLSGLEPARVSPAAARHLIACAAAAAALEAAFPSCRLVGEREMLGGEAGRSPAVPLRARRSGPRTHRPDLVLRAPGGRGLPIAVEVELTVKAPERLTEICLAWARCREVAGVLYLVSASASAPVERAVARACGGSRISVIALESLCGGPPERTIPRGT